MAIRKLNSNSYEAGDKSMIGADSVAFTYHVFVARNGAGALKLATSSDVIEGVSKEVATMASDNTTVAKATVNYEPQKEGTTWLCEITGGTVTIADEGKYYNLTDEDTVDGTSESATDGQLLLDKFVSATESVFVIVNKPADATS